MHAFVLDDDQTHSNIPNDTTNEDDGMRDVNISPIGLYSYLLKLAQAEANRKGRYILH